MSTKLSTLRESPITVYVLELQDGCYYVGQSCKFRERIYQHFTNKGSAWTRLHPPVKVICAKTVKTRDWKVAERIENRLTIFLMRHHGWTRVRGGFWSNTCEISTARNLEHHNKHSVIESGKRSSLPTNSGGGV
ncbi:GIY-YIG nuclease family protein [Luteimonas sp. SJ-16]|uniref:GIY-YIG nuclease family protein n=2 Tax=Luteimonas deserti TaxID=2752306 RepID=A0A7Z0TV98_9GAMM|nr:GIY-YIG nuclease family protein [Luteimonas deserti]